ncbi:MAG: hypothetical protein V1886_02665 [archaeon]
MSLTKIALIISLVGTAFLFFLSGNIEPKLTKISGIGSSMLGQDVKIECQIASERFYSGMAILNAEDETGSIDVIAYGIDKNQTFLGKNVEILGRVKEYKGQLEIEALKISEK